MLADLRFAVRQLRRSPLFALSAIATIALAIAMNTTMFAIVNAVLIQPLPYPNPEQLADLVTTYHTAAAAGFEDSQDGIVWEMTTERVSALAWGAYSTLSSGVTLVAGGPRHVRQQRVSAGFLRVLGVQPAAGRSFTPEEDRDGGPAAVILSNALWHSAFNGDPSAVGRSVTVRGEPHTIVGVMPPGFRTTIDADLWTPLRPSTTGEGEGQNYGVVGRLAPGRTWAEADAQVAAISDEALRHFRPSPDAHAALRLLPLQRVLTEPQRKPLLMLWAAVAAVLLIGVANTAGLLVARAAVRRQEFATRRALGASHAAILRQLGAESFVLAACGAACGLAMSIASAGAVSRILSATFGVWQPVSIDARVAAATIVVALLAMAAVALVPAWQLLRVRSFEPAGGRVAGPAQRWPRRLLIFVELALTMALVVVTAVLVRSFAHLRLLDPGFDGSQRHRVERVAAGRALRIGRTHQRVVRRDAQARPRGCGRRLRGCRRRAPVSAHAQPRVPPARRARRAHARRANDLHVRDAGVLRALGIRLRSGRTIRDTDTGNSEKVVVVNQAFVGRYLSGQAAVGSHLAVTGRTRVIAGVVDDVQQEGWSSPIAALPAIYAPAAQLDDGFFRTVHVWFAPHWIVKTSAPAGDVERALRQALSDVDPTLVFAGFQTIDEARGNALALQRAEAWLLSAFAILALVLCAIGAYGLIATLVVERRREFGIRLALGAAPWRSAIRAATPGIALAVGGAVAGALAARAMTTLLTGLVWGVSASDPGAFAAAALMLVAVGTIASVLPAIQIARLDPAVTLRAE